MKTKLLIFLSWLLLLGISSCSKEVVVAENDEAKLLALGIPKGHLPPPGHYRIWYPNREAGQQPAPQKLPVIVNQVPVGTWVIYRANPDETHVIMDVYDSQKPGVVIEVRNYTVSY